MEQRYPSSETDEDLAQVMKGQGPCTYLLLSLLGIILAFPYFQTSLAGRVALGVLFSTVLLWGAYAIGHSRRTLVVELALAIFGIALQWAGLLTGDIATLEGAAIAYAALLAILIGGILRYLLKRGPVTADKLHGALAGYIMLAFLWAFIYAAMERSHPGSFGPHPLDFRDAGAFFRLIYFSFTVLTTTGFGDITPATDQARSFVIIEEFAGVFFVGVLIARLAGLYPPTTKR